MGNAPQCSSKRRLGGPQSRSEQHGEAKILDTTGTRTPTPLAVHPRANLYTDCVTAAVYIDNGKMEEQRTINEEWCLLGCYAVWLL
jgi:hypothetical protein